MAPLASLLRLVVVKLVSFGIVVALLLIACADRRDDAEKLSVCAEHGPERAGDLRRGLWILAEGSRRVLEDPARIERLIQDSAEAGVSDLFVQVYRGGRSWYRSTHADDTPFRSIQAQRGVNAETALEQLVRQAHARGLRVHAWFNVLSLNRNKSAPLLRKVGRDAVLVDRKNRNLLEYPHYDIPLPDRKNLRLGTPGIYLDPGVPAVVEYLVQTVADLVQAAPDLDGLHLDYIRHPITLPIVPGSAFSLGLDFGYREASRSRFEQEKQRRFARGEAWDDFRREQVDGLVQALGAQLPDRWEYSAAVLPWADRAYLTAMQDWRRWLEQGWVDFVIAMAYTRDDRLLHYLAHELCGGVGGERVWLGLGSWLFLQDPARINAQIEQALEAHPAGVALFSYDAMAERSGLLAQIRWGLK